MNEFELRIKQALEKVAYKHTPSDEELERVKTSAINTPKLRINRLAAIAACLTFVILIAAVAGILLKGGNLDPGNNSSKTHSGATNNDSSENSSSEGSEVITGSTFAERHPELAAFPEGYRFISRLDIYAYSGFEKDLAGKEAANLFEEMLSPANSIYMGDITPEDIGFIDFSIELKKAGSPTYKLSFYINGYFVYKSENDNGTYNEWYYNPDYENNHPFIFISRHPDLAALPAGYDLDYYVLGNKADDLPVKDILAGQGKAKLYENIFAPEASLYIGDKQPVVISTELYYTIRLNRQDSPDYTFTYYILDNVFCYEYEIDGTKHTEWYYNPNQFSQRSLSYISYHPDLKTLPEGFKLSYGTKKTNLTEAGEDAEELYDSMITPNKSYLTGTPAVGLSIYYYITISGGSEKYEFTVYNEGYFKITYESNGKTLEEWYRNPYNDYRISLLSLHPVLTTLKGGTTFSIVEPFGEKRVITPDRSDAPVMYDEVFMPDKWYLADESTLPDLTGINYVTVIIGDYSAKIYANRYMLLNGEEWYYCKTSYNPVTSSAPLKSCYPNLESLEGLNFPVDFVNTASYSNIDEVMPLYWEIITRNGEVEVQNLSVNTLFSGTWDKYIMFNIAGRYNIYLYSNLYVRIDETDNGIVTDSKFFYKASALDDINDPGNDLAIVSEMGKDNFNMVIVYQKLWIPSGVNQSPKMVIDETKPAVVYIKGKKYILDNKYNDNTSDEYVTIPGTGYNQKCNYRAVVKIDGESYAYLYASTACYDCGLQLWYPVSLKDVKRWNESEETPDFIKNGIAIINGREYPVIEVHNLTEGDYYVTYHGVEYKCDQEAVLFDGEKYLVYPFHHLTPYVDDGFPVADVCIRTFKSKTTTLPNIDMRADILENVRFVYGVYFDSKLVYLISEPEIIDGRYYYYIYSHFVYNGQDLGTIRGGYEIPGGISSVVAIDSDTIHITDNADGLSPISTVWEVQDTGQDGLSDLEKVYSEINGNTFARYHPDKLDLKGYALRWSDEKDMFHCITGSYRDQIYSLIIDNGQIERVNNPASVDLTNVRSDVFEASADGLFDVHYMIITVYENGYLKYDTSIPGDAEKTFELYYNPKGYDLDKLFDPALESGNINGALITEHPEIDDVMAVHYKATVLKMYGSEEGAEISYSGYLAELIYKSVIGDGEYSRLDIDGKNLGDCYHMKLVMEEHTCEVMVYDDVLAYRTGNNSGWEYYKRPYLINCVGYILEYVNTFVKEKNASFEIEGVPITYKAEFDNNYAFAIAEVKKTDDSTYYDIFHTGDGGKTWTMIRSDLAVDGYIQCYKAIGKETLLFLTPNYDDDGSTLFYCMGTDGSFMNLREIERLASILTDGLMNRKTDDVEDILSEILLIRFQSAINGSESYRTVAHSAFSEMLQYAPYIRYAGYNGVDFKNGSWDVVFCYHDDLYPWITLKAGLTISYDFEKGKFIITEIYSLNKTLYNEYIAKLGY